MKVPPEFVDALRARVSLVDIVGRKVRWDMRKTNQARGDWWAACPFHQEKTASFHADEQKGYYYCFGCQAKGDVIGFVCASENVGFLDAVKILAQEAGMPLPERESTPAQAARMHRTEALRAAMDIAARFCQNHLQTGNTDAARTARAYLVERGFDANVQKQFVLGVAPATKNGGIVHHLQQHGIAQDILIESGLALVSDRTEPKHTTNTGAGGNLYDRFQNRLIFPIHDVRGACIAFGGRDLYGHSKAKYVNSPETDLFHKGRTLYNHHIARAAVRTRPPLYIVEGYTDVIALTTAGVDTVVAPLGTAITEQQLALLWRMSFEPVLALDGDAAGLRALSRVVDMALPLLSGQQSLRFCLLPKDQDPDTILRTRGVDALRALLANHKPLPDWIWQHTLEGRVLDSPERKAAFEHALFVQLQRIADKSVRYHYRQDIKMRLADLFAIPARNNIRDSTTGVPLVFADTGAQHRPRRRYGRYKSPYAAHALAETKQSAIAHLKEEQPHFMRTAAVLALCLQHPRIAVRFLPDLAECQFDLPEHEKVYRAFADYCTAGSDQSALDKTAVLQHITQVCGKRVVHALLKNPHVRMVPGFAESASIEAVEFNLSVEIKNLTTLQGAEREIRDALLEATNPQAFDSAGSDRLAWRISQANQARNTIAKAKDTNKDDENETATSAAYLQSIIEQQIWIKKK